jgi:hypothetical protein
MVFSNEGVAWKIRFLRRWKEGWVVITTIVRIRDICDGNQLELLTTAKVDYTERNLRPKESSARVEKESRYRLSAFGQASVGGERAMKLMTSC